MNEVPVQARLRPRSSALFACAIWLSMVGDGAAAAEPLYQIEVVVFHSLQVPAASRDAQPTAAASVDEGVATIEQVTLPAESLLLTEAVKRLNGSGRYRTALHHGWRQNALQNQPVRIGDHNGSGETGVSGYATVQVGQQLAMNIALACNRDGAGTILRARRTIRVGELHYIDGRLCGALVQVTRVRASGE
jgi:hypothetical protein